MDEIIARVPPNDVQAEQAVLGLMLVDKDAVLTVIEMLKPSDFYKPEHEEIYAAISGKIEYFNYDLIQL